MKHQKAFLPVVGTLTAALLMGVAGCNRPQNDTVAGNGGAASAAGAAGASPALPATPPVADNSGTSNAPTVASNGSTTTNSTGATDTTGTAGTTTPGAMVDANPTAAGSGTTAGTAAGTAATNQAAAAGPLNAADSAFVKTAAGSGIYEVEVAKLAADKASDPAIKSFASMLVEHHTAANDKLKQVVAGRGVELPSEAPADKRKVIDSMGKLSGAAFDRQFVQTVGIKDHKTDIALFQKASKNAKDSDVRNFASTTLPTLQSHLDAAQKLPPANGSKNSG